MADVRMWQDKEVRIAFEKKARARLEALQSELEDAAGIVAIEPNSGQYFLGTTLGHANKAAFAAHPDQWCYFVRLDDFEAAISLPTW
jgi:hypothetical protein